MLLNRVKATKGISSNPEKKEVNGVKVNTAQPIESKRLSHTGASNENKKVNRIKEPLLIRMKRKKTVRMYHKALFFGKKPKIIPKQTACAIAPG